jgi:hypothetical protein
MPGLDSLEIARAVNLCKAWLDFFLPINFVTPSKFLPITASHQVSHQWTPGKGWNIVDDSGKLRTPSQWIDIGRTMKKAA